ncbi:MAG: type II toxin-antitoxin system HicB family antitoxin [Candidatus Cloacimonetes bacterium]|nr:type II toxin-antitoxin system HicB family antitoxin [Candidatus Cloacimonadota bacterium]
MEFRGTVKVEKGQLGYVATCLDNDVVSQGDTIEEAIKNVKEAIACHYEGDANKEELEYYKNHEILISRVDVKF